MTAKKQTRTVINVKPRKTATVLHFARFKSRSWGSVKSKNAHDHALTSPSPTGGIDLNSANMSMTVTKDAQGGVKVDFNPALIAQIRKQGISSAVPVIISVSPISKIQLQKLF